MLLMLMNTTNWLFALWVVSSVPSNPCMWRVLRDFVYSNNFLYSILAIFIVIIISKYNKKKGFVLLWPMLCFLLVLNNSLFINYCKWCLFIGDMLNSYAFSWIFGFLFVVYLMSLVNKKESNVFILVFGVQFLSVLVWLNGNPPPSQWCKVLWDSLNSHSFWWFMLSLILSFFIWRTYHKSVGRVLCISFIIMKLMCLISSNWESFDLDGTFQMCIAMGFSFIFIAWFCSKWCSMPHKQVLTVLLMFTVILIIWLLLHYF